MNAVGLYILMKYIYIGVIPFQLGPRYAIKPFIFISSNFVCNAF